MDESKFNMPQWTEVSYEMTTRNAFKYQMPLQIAPNQYPYSMCSSSLLKICDSANQKSNFILWFYDLSDYELLMIGSMKGSGD